VTPSQLRTFLAVAETGSVRAAAESLVVSQPAVSAVLASLRRELGVALVEREGRGLRLTKSGVVLAGYAQRLLGLLEEAASASRAEADPEVGTLRLAAVTTAGERVVPAILAGFRKDFPRVDIGLEVGNRTRIWELLAGHRVDLAVGGRPTAGSGLVTLAERPHELVVVSAPDETSSAAGPRTVTPAELGRRTWLLRESGSGTRATADELLAELGLTPAILTVGSNGAIAESVRVGLGIALLSRDAVAGQLEDGSLVELRAGPLPLRRLWCVVGRGGEVLPATAALFLSQVSTRGKEGSPPPPFRRTPQVNRVRRRK
jgi:LysR family transcriptional regulator, low CO2-responsive transcriptional regulator